MHVERKLRLLCGMMFMVATLSAGGLVATPANAQDKQPSADGLKVTVMVYSGRPDPTYVIKDTSSVERVATLLQSAKENNEVDAEAAFPSTLGYKGILVENLQSLEGMPTSFVVLNQNIQVGEQGMPLRYDREERLQKYLIEEGAKKGAISADLVRTLKEASLRINNGR